MVLTFVARTPVQSADVGLLVCGISSLCASAPSSPQRRHSQLVIPHKGFSGRGPFASVVHGHSLTTRAGCGVTWCWLWHRKLRSAPSATQRDLCETNVARWTTRDARVSARWLASVRLVSILTRNWGNARRLARSDWGALMSLLMTPGSDNGRGGVDPLAAIAHDLRQPIATLRALVGALKASDVSPRRR
jgi:hypothetical protein